mgnify:CR=1 FL=1
MDMFDQILLQYWGYHHFRPLQKEIIESVYNGNDTLGLMPTGGGKSIVFQVVAMASEGVCLVVTPLIALMKDQVDNLWARQIKAVAIYSGMSFEEISAAFDKCLWGGYKFLYVSPERLKTEHFLTRIKSLKINLIVVDEAHCISSWGYDFRPSYLEIAQIRELLPDIKILALTATATPDVVNDITEKLHFSKKSVFSTSFERKNLAYLAREREDKVDYLVMIALKNRGAGIVYVRNRNKTQEVAIALRKKGLNADYYHAGLNAKERSKKQAYWKDSADSIMVCTNAFGMGIDKPDVRFVVHLDLPESPEEYFQEAGRAGRDGNQSYAVLLYNQADIERLRKNVEVNFPPIPYLKRVYEALANYFQIPVGSNNGSCYDFSISDFCDKFKLEILPTYNAIKTLEQEGYFVLSESSEVLSKVKFTVERDKLYKFQVANRQFDSFIKLLLRTYTGLFTDFTRIDEQRLSTLSTLPVSQVKKYLETLSNGGVLFYSPARTVPILFYTNDRVETSRLTIDVTEYNARKKRYNNRVEAMIHYASSHSKCRSLILLEYFGQRNATRCGNCDVCRKRNELDMSAYTFDLILNDIKHHVRSGSYSITDLVKVINHPEESISRVVQYLLDNGKMIDMGDVLKWHD